MKKVVDTFMLITTLGQQHGDNPMEKAKNGLANVLAASCPMDGNSFEIQSLESTLQILSIADR